MKPICVKCERFYRPKKNGTPFVEMMPKSGFKRPESGTTDRDAWEPYKLWHGDLWACQGCGHELIVGTGSAPISEHFRPDFTDQIMAWGAKLIVNDC